MAMAIHWNGQAFTEVAAPGAYGIGGRRVVARQGTTPGEVRRVVEAPARALELVGLLGQVPAGEARMTFRGVVERRHETGELRTYRALLRFPGLLARTQRVEIDVLSYGPTLGTLSIRCAEPLARPISALRYEQAARAALASIERLLPWQAATSGALVAPIAEEPGVVEEASAVAAPADDVLSDVSEGERAA